MTFSSITILNIASSIKKPKSINRLCQRKIKLCTRLLSIRKSYGNYFATYISFLIIYVQIPQVKRNVGLFPGFVAITRVNKKFFARILYKILFREMPKLHVLRTRAVRKTSIFALGDIHFFRNRLWKLLFFHDNRSRQHIQQSSNVRTFLGTSSADDSTTQQLDSGARFEFGFDTPYSAKLAFPNLLFI